MATIYEVAKRAGVSTATVSRVLSRPDVVAPNTRRKVLQAVERLGFTPNAISKSLRTLRTGKLIVNMAGETYVFPIEDPRDAANSRSEHDHARVP